jgi:hypothetical protein
VATAVIAVAGFLGLGGIFGQWAVDRIGDLVEGDSPPPGFNELHAGWQDTAKLSERLRAAGMRANKDLEDGVLFLGTRMTPNLLDDLIVVRGIRRDAHALAGRIRATSTDLTGQRADLVRLVTLVGDTTQRVETGIQNAYLRYRGERITLDPGDFQPISSNELRDDVDAQDDLVTQVTAGLNPTARRFGRPIPKVQGWLRLVQYEALSDKPFL